MNIEGRPNRVATMVTLSPDEQFLIVGTKFDEPAEANPDGSPILWVKEDDGRLRSIASNAPDPDGLIVFPVEGRGTLLSRAVVGSGPVGRRRRPSWWAGGRRRGQGRCARLALGPVRRRDPRAAAVPACTAVHPSTDVP